MLVDLDDSPDVVAVVVPQRRTSGDLQRTIDSISAQKTDLRVGIKVISRSGHAPIKLHEPVSVFVNDHALSLGGVLNVARSEMSPTFLWILAEGTAPNPYCLDVLYEMLRENPTLALVRPVPRRPNGQIPAGKLGGLFTSGGDAPKLYPETETFSVTKDVSDRLEFLRLPGSLIRLSAWDDVDGMDAGLLSDVGSEFEFFRKLTTAGYTFTHANEIHVEDDGPVTEGAFDAFLRIHDATRVLDSVATPVHIEGDHLPSVTAIALEKNSRSSSQALTALGDLLDDIVEIDEAEDESERIPVLLAAGFSTQYAGQQAGWLVGILRSLNRFMRRVRFAVDPAFYRRAYPDLRSLTTEQAALHWKSGGGREGRFPSRQAVETQARVHGISLKGIDVAEYVLANPHLVGFGITAYEAAYVIMAGDVKWLRRQPKVSLPKAFFDALSDLSRSGANDGWAYTREPSELENDSPLDRRFSAVPADAFILEVFRFFVGHPPSSSGFQLWVARIDSGEYSRAATIVALAQAGPYELIQFTEQTRAAEIAQASLDLAMHRHVNRKPSDIIELMGIPVARRTDWYRSAVEALSATSRKPVEELPTQKPRRKAPRAPRATALVSLFRSDPHIASWIKNVTQLQNFHDFEFVIVSVDPSETEKAHLEAFSASHDNVVLVYKDAPFGIYAAWNLALQLATADYVTNMNVDDIRAPRSLVVQSDLLDKYDWVDVVYQEVMMSIHGNVSWEELEHIDAACAVPIVSTALLLTGKNPPHNGPMWRKSLHSELGYFNEALRSAADYDFWLRCSRAGKTFFQVPDPHVGYFDNPNGMSTSSEGIGLREGREILAANQLELLTEEAPPYVLKLNEFDPLTTRTDRMTAGFVSALIRERSQ